MLSRRSGSAAAQGKRMGEPARPMEQPHSQEYTESQAGDVSGLHRCSFDPEVETALGCGKCGEYICPRCMIQTPVGARCRDCVRITKDPTYDVKPSYYLRAGLAGGVVGVVGGLLWGLLLTLHIPFLPWLLAMGVGYLVGETVSVAANRKRGTSLAVIAGVSMALAVLAMLAVTPPISIIFLLLAVALSSYMAISRVR